MSDSIGLIEAKSIIHDRPKQKPCHIIYFNTDGIQFLTIDKPIQENGIINAKGIFLIGPKKKNVEVKFNDLLTQADKEQIEEIAIPLTSIFYMKNLIYKSK